MFKTMTGCLNKNSNPSEEEIKKIPSFIFCRWLSGNPSTVLAANQINYFHNQIPITNQYKMVKSVFGGKIKYIPYPKDLKESDNKKCEYLSLYFKISPEKAKEYLSFISTEEINNIVKMFEKE